MERRKVKIKVFKREFSIITLIVLSICILVPLSASLAVKEESVNHSGNVNLKDNKGALDLLDFSVLSDFRKEKGLRNLEPQSIALLEKGVEALQAGNKVLAVKFFENARELSPDLPQTYLYLAKANFSLSFKGLSVTMSYLRDAWKALLNNFWWSFRTSGNVMISVYLALYVSIIILFIVLISSKFSLYMHDIVEDRKKIILLVPSIIFVLFGPIFGLFAFMLPFWVYLKKKEKALLYSVFVVTSIVILTAPFLSSFFSVSSDVTLRNIVNINSGLYSGDTVYLLRDRSEYETAFTYALDLKRKGNYKEAIEIYKSLLGKRGKKADAKIYNNIANCYVGLKDNKTALFYYNKALKTSKIASAYYNLSQMHREFFNFKEAKKYYKEALDISSEKVRLFMDLRGTTVNSFVADEVLSIKELWSLAFKRTSDDRSSKDIVRMLSFTNGWVSVLLILTIIAAVTAYDRKVFAVAYRCLRCGSIYCSYCEKKLAHDDVCHTCHMALSEITQLSPKERISRIVEIHRHRDNKNQRLKIMTLILPGSGHIYYGWTTFGFFIMLLFTFFLLSVFVWTYSLPSLSMTQLADMLKMISVASLFLIYIATGISVFRKVPRKWR